MEAHLSSQSQSHSQSSRCCPCMKTGRCIRCTCVKKGLPCTDCWPSTTNPVRCQNLGYSAPSASSSSEENQVRSRSNNPADPNDHLTAVSCPKSLTESPPVDHASDCTATNVLKPAQASLEKDTPPIKNNGGKKARHYYQ